MSRKLFKAAPLILALAALPEAAFWLGFLASGRPPAPGSCAVLVLGFPTRDDGSAHPIQRFRVETGVSVFRRQSCGLMALSGGSPHSGYTEAETMATLALAAGVPKDRLFLEKLSRTTRENIRFSLPALEKHERVFIVSGPLHVHRGRRYWCEERPDLCSRAFAATAYRPLRLYAMKWAETIGELANRLRDSIKGPSRDRPATRS